MNDGDDIVARLREEGFITHMARLPREWERALSYEAPHGWESTEMEGGNGKS